MVDLSLSKVARGNILDAWQKGETIPQGWALDAKGKPTTDPAAALAGTMLPLGDAKGTALALMVELLAAGLTGANFAGEASSFLDAEGAPPGTGQMLIAFDPAAFGGAGALAHFAAAGRGDRKPAGRPSARRAAARIARKSRARRHRHQPSAARGNRGGLGRAGVGAAQAFQPLVDPADPSGGDGAHFSGRRLLLAIAIAAEWLARHLGVAPRRILHDARDRRRSSQSRNAAGSS